MAKRKKTARGYSTRKVNTRKIIQRFLIVCEGEKTEPNYFRGFHIPTTVIIDIKGLGCNPSKLVERAKELSKEEDYDQIWCVFDRDDWLLEDFNNAIDEAKNKKLKIKVAYSNEAFELWYLLHFEFFHTGISRKDYCKKLTNLLGYKYEKNSETIYNDLLCRQTTAIQNAENLLSQYDKPNPARDNPSTTVHLLVKELKEFAR